MLGHGAAGILFFRYRAAVFGQEEFCYGVLDHATPRASGRKFEEAKQVFALGRDHAALWLSPLVARVAIVYDFDNVFAWQAQPQSDAFAMEAEMVRMYEPFWKQGVTIDVISAKRLLSGEIPLDQYAVVVLPVPMVIDSRLVGMLEVWLGASRSSSGLETPRSLWVGYRSDLKELATSQMRRAPSRLATLAGVEVSEFESLLKGRTSAAQPVLANSISAQKDGAEERSTHRSRTSAEVQVFQEGLQILPARANDTQALWVYSDPFFGGLGLAAVTRREFTSGSEVVYMGCGIDTEALESIARASLIRTGLAPNLPALALPEGVELVQRKGAHVWVNHGSKDQTIDMAQPDGTIEHIALPPFGVQVKLPERG